MIVTIRSSSSDVISPALLRQPGISRARDGTLWFGAGGGIPFVQIHIGLLADQVRITASDTLDLGEGVHDLLLAIDVGIEQTKNELEVRLLS